MTTWNLHGTTHHILICNGGSCLRQLGDEVTRAIRDEISAHDADESIHTTRTRCNGRCEDACVVTVYPEGVWYRDITPELGREIVRKHLIGGEPLQEQVVFTFDGSHGLVASGQGPVGIRKKRA